MRRRSASDAFGIKGLLYDFLILTAIEDKRTQVFESLGTNFRFVIILVTEVSPDNLIPEWFHYERNRAAT